MSDKEKIEKLEKLVSNYKKLSAKRQLVEAERDELEKKAFKMLSEHIKNSEDTGNNNE